MSQKPLFSIITICWNAAETLPPTMKSVAQQRFRDFEHILVDGASTDNSLALARALGTDRLRIISEPDNGIYDAMNKGLAMAKGEYLIFMNAGDTFYDDSTLEAYASATGKDVDIIYGDTLIVDADRNVIGPRHLSAPEILTAESYKAGMLVCHQAFMVRRKIAPEYDTSFRFSADYEWSLRCIEATVPGRCVYLHRPVALYLSEGTTDKNMMKSLRERFRIMCSHFGTLPTAGRHAAFLLRYMKRKISGHTK